MNVKVKTIVVYGLVSGAVFAALANAEDENHIVLDKAPAAVQAAVKKTLGDNALVSLSKEDEDGKISYEAEFKVKDVSHSSTFAADGSLLEQETEVKLDRLPPEVTAAITKAEPTGTPKEASEVVTGGKTFYEIDVKVGDVKHELKVSIDGKLIANEIEKNEKD